MNQPFMDRIKQQEPAPTWSLWLALGMALAFGVLWILGQIIAATVEGDVTVLSPTALAIGALIGCLIAIGGVVLWGRRRGNLVAQLRLIQPKFPPIFVVVLVGLGSAWAIDLIGVLTNLKSSAIAPPVLQTLQAPIGVVWVLTAILAIFIQPIAEGMIFYGLLYGSLADRFKNNIAAIIAVAICYTLVSAAVLSADANVWFLLIQPLLMALVIGGVRAYTGSTQSAIVARAFFGVFFVFAAIISQRF